jgi:hypothetical protein
MKNYFLACFGAMGFIAAVVGLGAVLVAISAKLGVAVLFTMFFLSLLYVASHR